jgi:RNAse H-fold protein YqgF
LHMHGEEGEAAKKARRLGNALGANLGLDVAYWDERLTTVQAERVLIEGGVRRKQRKGVIDQVAAVLILQAYLDSRAPADDLDPFDDDYDPFDT